MITETALPRRRKRHRTPLPPFEASATVPLDTASLAALLGRLAALGCRVSDEPRTVEGVTAWAWRELYRLEPQTARLAFHAAVSDRAPIDVVISLAELLVTESLIRPKGATDAA